MSFPSIRCGLAGTSTGVLAIVGSAVGFGLNPLLATNAMAAGISPQATGFLRVALVFVALLPVAPQVWRWRRGSVVAAVGGALNGLGLVAFYACLDRVPLAVATVVYYTYPLFVLALSAVVLNRAPRGRDWTMGALILAGVGAGVGPAAVGSGAIGALGLALAAPVAWSIYLLLLAGPLAKMPTLPKLLSGSGGGTLVLLPLSLGADGLALMPPTWGAAVAVTSLAVCSMAIPALLVVWGAARVGERTTALAGSLEFVVAMAAGWLFLGGAITPWQVAGVALIFGAFASTATDACSRRVRRDRP